MSADTFRVIQPGDICWLLSHRHWATLEYVLQTVTLNGNFLIVELWHDGADSDSEPEIREYLSVSTDLKTLQTSLANIAERYCRKHIESLVAANYWKTDFEKTIARLSHMKRIKAQGAIESFESRMSDLKARVETKDELSQLIALCNQLDEDCEKVNQLYYA